MLQKVRPQRDLRNNNVQEYQNTKNKMEKESKNKKIVTRETAQLFGRHTKAQRQTAQKTKRVHGASKMMIEDRLEQMQIRENPHPEGTSTPMKSLAARMPSLEETSMGHHYQSAPTWDN